LSFQGTINLRIKNNTDQKLSVGILVGDSQIDKSVNTTTISTWNFLNLSFNEEEITFAYTVNGNEVINSKVLNDSEKNINGYVAFFNSLNIANFFSNGNLIVADKFRVIQASLGVIQVFNAPILFQRDLFAIGLFE